MRKVIQGVSEKQIGVADYHYFENGNTQQCNVFRHNKYLLSFCLCVKFQPDMSNVTKVMNAR